MNLEKLANGDKILEPTAQIHTETEALARFNEMSEYLDFYRPHDVAKGGKLPLAWEDAESYNMICFFPPQLVGLLLAVSSVAFGVTGSGWALAGIAFSSLMGVGLGVFYGIHSNSGRAENKLRNFLCNVFLTKKAKAKVRANGQILDDFYRSSKLFGVLVEKVRAQLEAEGVFELVNHRGQTKFIHLNAKGEGEYLSLKQWKSVKAELSEAKEHQMEIIKELS